MLIATKFVSLSRFRKKKRSLKRVKGKNKRRLSDNTYAARRRGRRGDSFLKTYALRDLT